MMWARVVVAAALTAAGLALAAEPGHVQVKCEPGVRILLDGDFQGAGTADLGGVVIENVAAGRHTIRAVKEGFEPQDHTVDVVPKKVAVWEARSFVPKTKIKESGGQGDKSVGSRQVGTIIIQSLPIECTVDIPSAGVQNYSKTKDEMTVSDVPAGEHKAVFKGAKELIATLRVEPNVVTRVMANFAKGEVTAKVEKPEAPVGQADYTQKNNPAAELSLDLGNKVTMKFVLIPAGRFTMGSPDSEKDHQPYEGPQHEVTIGKAFYMGVYEVTQEQYEAVIGSNPSRFKGASNPVERVSWDDAVAFCKKLSAKTGKTVRLPTEAEWEYACRAGSKTRFCFGDDDSDLGGYAWYRSNSDAKTHPAGAKKPNAFGLYDMHGNVWEWCSDWYADSYANANTRDPAGPSSGSNRVLRGGRWCDDPRVCRSADRDGFGPSDRGDSVGFRVVLDSQ